MPDQYGRTHNNSPNPWLAPPPHVWHGANMTLEIKRVVTGVDANGTSIFYEDAVLPPLTAGLFPGTEFFQLWGTEGALASPVVNPMSDNKGFFPGLGGTRFGLFRFPPEIGAPDEAPAPDEETLNALVAESEEVLPGLLGVFEPDAPGFHQTVTIDYAVVIEGDLWLELDNGAETHLPVGSTIIQNGARHAWHNHGDVPATLAYVILSVG
ncbi:cupin domain-containing protein [soil metagenome]